MISLTAALQMAGAALQADSQAIGITGQNLTNQTTPDMRARLCRWRVTDTILRRTWPVASASTPAIPAASSRSRLSGISKASPDNINRSRKAHTRSPRCWTEQRLGIVRDFELPQPALTELLHLAASPNSAAAQNGLIQNAQAFAGDLNSAAQTIQQTVTSAQSQAQNIVSEINQLVGQVQQYNQQIQSGSAPGATAEAQIILPWKRSPTWRPSLRSKTPTALFRSC